MKNIIIVLLLVVSITLVISFTNNSPVLTEAGEYSQDDGIGTDTLPGKKDSVKRKTSTNPYDSFGKPKKMDTTKLK